MQIPVVRWLSIIHGVEVFPNWVYPLVYLVYFSPSSYGLHWLDFNPVWEMMEAIWIWCKNFMFSTNVQKSNMLAWWSVSFCLYFSTLMWFSLVIVGPNSHSILFLNFASMFGLLLFLLGKSGNFSKSLQKDWKENLEIIGHRFGTNLIRFFAWMP